MDVLVGVSPRLDKALDKTSFKLSIICFYLQHQSSDQTLGCHWLSVSELGIFIKFGAQLELENID
jgi:hypothetical protein